MLTGLVDTRRLYSIVPAPILEELGVKREEYRRFRREDGFVRQLGIGLARLELHGKTASVYIVFGDDPQETVIGAMTLTVFGLAADPIQERPVIRTVDIMTAIPHITEAAIRAKVTAKSFARGEAYYCQGAVESATRRGSQLFAAVQGSEWEPYRVGVAITDGDFTASCTCPYDWEGYCKHIVATLLTYINPDDGHSVPIATATPIADLLAGLDAPALRTLVHRLIAADPALADIVDEFCNPDESC